MPWIFCHVASQMSTVIVVTYISMFYWILVQLPNNYVGILPLFVESHILVKFPQPLCFLLGVVLTTMAITHIEEYGRSLCRSFIIMLHILVLAKTYGTILVRC